MRHVTPPTAASLASLFPLSLSLSLFAFRARADALHNAPRRLPRSPGARMTTATASTTRNATAAAKGILFPSVGPHFSACAA